MPEGGMLELFTRLFGRRGAKALAAKGGAR
jgi:hypothetical protein